MATEVGTDKPRKPFISQVTGKLVVQGDEMVTKEEAKLMKGGYTWNQILMRRDMSQPVKLSTVLDEVVGDLRDDDVSAEAHLIINEHATGLVLGFKEWAIVQKLVEAGIVSGRAGS